MTTVKGGHAPVSKKFETYKSKTDTKHVQNIKSQKRTRHTAIDKIEYIFS